MQMKNIGSYSEKVYLLCCVSTYRLLCKLVMHLKILTDSAKCVGTQGPALETLGHLGIPEPRWHFTFPLQTKPQPRLQLTDQTILEEIFAADQQVAPLSLA